MSTNAAFHGSKEPTLANVRVRGTAIVPLRPFIESKFGLDGAATMSRLLSAEAREIFEQPLIGLSWYPFEAGLEIIDALVTLAPARAGATVLRDFAFYNLSYATNVIFRTIFKVGTPEFMIARSDQVWKRFYSHGRMTCETRKKGARVELHDFPYLTPHYSRLVMYGMEAVVEKAGAQFVSGVQTRSVLEGDPFSEFVYEWR